MWHETPASVHPHCFPPSMTRLHMTGLSITSRTCIQWCYSWPFSLPLSGMSAHLTFNDSVVVNIHTYWHIHTSVVPPDMLRVATCLFWIFRTPSLLPALPFLVLQTCLYCAGPKGHNYNNYYQRKLFYFWSSIHVKYTTCKALFCICFIQFWMRGLPAVWCTYFSNPVHRLYQYSPPAYPQMWLNGDQMVREWGCGGSL